MTGYVFKCYEPLHCLTLKGKTPIVSWLPVKMSNIKLFHKSGVGVWVYERGSFCVICYTPKQHPNPLDHHHHSLRQKQGLLC